MSNSRDAPRVPRCPVCGAEIAEGRPDKQVCGSLCRSRIFRARQKRLGRRRTHSGYADGLSAWDARERFGDPA